MSSITRLLPPLCFATVAALAAGCTQAAQADKHQVGMHETSTVVRYGGLPARLCLPADADIVATVARGETRLSLQLRNRTPSSRYSPAFHLLLIDHGSVRRPLETFGMQVDHVEHGNAAPQRFLFDLRDAGLMPDADGKVCFEVERDSDAEVATPVDAQLEITLGWQVAPGR